MSNVISYIWLNSNIPNSYLCDPTPFLVGVCQVEIAVNLPIKNGAANSTSHPDCGRRRRFQRSASPPIELRWLEVRVFHDRLVY